MPFKKTVLSNSVRFPLCLRYRQQHGDGTGKSHVKFSNILPNNAKLIARSCLVFSIDVYNVRFGYRRYGSRSGAGIREEALVAAPGHRRLFLVGICDTSGRFSKNGTRQSGNIDARRRNFDTFLWSTLRSECFRSLFYQTNLSMSGPARPGPAHGHAFERLISLRLWI